MPSKIQLDENLWFLYICLQKSDYKTIDFNAVSEATNLKPPAARMRYTRLRRQIEGGTLIGTHGTPFNGGADKIAEATRKRKKPMPSSYNEDDPRKTEPGASDDPENHTKSEHSDPNWESSSEYSDSDGELPLSKRILRTNTGPTNANSGDATASPQEASEFKEFARATFSHDSPPGSVGMEQRESLRTIGNNSSMQFSFPPANAVDHHDSSPYVGGCQSQNPDTVLHGEMH